MVCRVFRSVVVETCVDCCAADRAAPTAAPLLEYCESLFAIFSIASFLHQASGTVPQQKEFYYSALSRQAKIGRVSKTVGAKGFNRCVCWLSGRLRLDSNDQSRRMVASTTKLDEC
jgi:hypothetical protein